MTAQEAKAPKAKTRDNAGRFVKSPDVDVAPDAQKAVDEIMAESAKVAEGMIQPDEIIDAKPETDAITDPGQADFIPGTRRPDPTYLPERVYDESLGSVRRVSLPKEYHYIWVVGEKLNAFRSDGYRFCQYDGGSQSGLANRGFLGTGLFERTLDNHVRNGDTFLMFADMRLFEHKQQEDRQKNDAWNRAAQTDYHNEGYRRGVRTFEEVDGKIVYN